MANYTPNFNFRKPSTGEYYDMVADLNDMKDKVDEAVSNVSINKYKGLFVGDDITAALISAITTEPNGTTIIFDSKKVYTISDTIIITKPITINFNNTLAYMKVQGKPVFDLQFTGESLFGNRIKIINYSFKKVAGYIPTNIFYVNGAINTLLQGSTTECVASHSLIWNYKGYNTNIIGEMRYSDCPRCIYLSNSSGSVHSFAFKINVDITGNSGKGIETEGANGQIVGVIESCVGGGYEYNGVHNATGINVSVHFENNTLFDMKIGGAVYVPGGATNSGIHNLIGSLFSRSINKSILYGSGQMISVIGCQLYSTAEPIDTNVVSTTINTLGNTGVYDEVLDAELLKLNYSLNQWGNHLVKQIETSHIKQAGAEDLILYLKNGTEMYLRETEMVPNTATFNLGGRWNMFKRVYAENTYLKSPNGKVWQLNVSDTGVITAYEEV